MFVSWVRRLGEFSVVFDPHGAEEECVSAVAAVKGADHIVVVSSCPVRRR